MISLTFPDSTYTSANKPDIETLKSDLTIVESAINIAEGSLVGTTATQTLTNKTLTSPTITNPTLSAQYQEVILPSNLAMVANANTELVRTTSLTVGAGQKVRLTGLVQGQVVGSEWSGWFEIHRDTISGSGLYGRVEAIHELSGYGNAQGFYLIDEPGAGSFVYILTGGIRGTGTLEMIGTITRLQVEVY